MFVYCYIQRIFGLKLFLVEQISLKFSLMVAFILHHYNKSLLHPMNYSEQIRAGKFGDKSNDINQELCHIWSMINVSSGQGLDGRLGNIIKNLLEKCNKIHTS